MPTLVVTPTPFAPIQIGSSSRLVNSSTSAITPRTSRGSLIRMPNSSSPMRATLATSSAKTARRCLATCISTRLPASWPNASFTPRNPSMSTCTSASDSGPFVPAAPSSQPRNCARFGNPVCMSLRLCRTSCVCSARISFMFSIIVTKYGAADSVSRTYEIAMCAWMVSPSLRIIRFSARMCSRSSEWISCCAVSRNAPRSSGCTRSRPLNRGRSSRL